MNISSVDDSLNHMKNRIRDIRRFYLVGMTLVILGNLLPWWCYGDFIQYCTSGVSIVGIQFSLLFSNPELLFTSLIFLVVIGLVYQSLGSRKSRKRYIIGVSIFVLGYLIFKDLLVIEDPDSALIFGSIGSSILGDRSPIFIFGRSIHWVLSNNHLVFLLTVVIVWMIFYRPKFVGRPNLMIAILGSMVVFISGYQLTYAFYWQIAERIIIGGLTVALGLPLILIGSLFIVTTAIKKAR